MPLRGAIHLQVHCNSHSPKTIAPSGRDLLSKGVTAVWSEMRSAAAEGPKDLYARLKIALKRKPLTAARRREFFGDAALSAGGVDGASQPGDSRQS